MRGIAVTGRTRLASLPNLPTFRRTRLAGARCRHLAGAAGAGQHAARDDRAAGARDRQGAGGARDQGAHRRTRRRGAGRGRGGLPRAAWREQTESYGRIIRANNIRLEWMQPTRIHAAGEPSLLAGGEFTEARLRAALPEAEAAPSFGMTEPALEAGLATAEVLLLAGQAPLHDLAAPRAAPALGQLHQRRHRMAAEGRAAAAGGADQCQRHAHPQGGGIRAAAVLMLNNQHSASSPPGRVTGAGRRSRPATVAGKTVLILGMGALGGAAADGAGAAGHARHRQQPLRPAASGRGGDDAGRRTSAPICRRPISSLIALPLTPATRGSDRRRRAGPAAAPRRRGEYRPRRDPGRRRAGRPKLRDGSLAGAVLDALPLEPLPPDRRLWTTPDLFVTPHCGLYDPAAYGPRCLEAFCANLARFRAGEPLHQLVDLGRGY